MPVLHPLPKQPDLNIPALERSLDLSSLTNSYKLYWFAALLDEINRCSAEISFRRMIILMISKCWYSVLKFRLNFGSLDMLHRLVHYIHEKYNLTAEITETELLKFLENIEDFEFEKALINFTKYVPYRFLSPFYEDKLRGIHDHLKNSIIEELSCKDDRAVYRIRSSDSKIEINYNWFEYLYCNTAIVTGWHRYRLVEFLQRRNPNVPSVIDKIEAPQKRNLSEARNFWKKIITAIQSPPPGDLGCRGYSGSESAGAIKDIYTGQRIESSDMSLDHFIPWSFVLHDQLWNLAPVSKRVNSSKSDLLPDLDKHLESFIDLQFMAYITAIESGIKSNALEDYYILGAGNNTSTPVPPPGDRGYSQGIIRESDFKGILRNTITPLHRIAQNQGFGLWR
ncbi:MAG: hypothetical protein CVV49_07170 [Spirochaetae bacterium HGW-Spirochaetae-5]|nr:MAG: hypothetical protein CVV49_07170 [Spirochaetae bacterium HGW-Spirochaetae-5]